MTMFRVVDWFDIEKFPPTAAEQQEGSYTVVGAWSRAHWEVLDQLRTNEQQIADQQERIGELREQVERLTAQLADWENGVEAVSYGLAYIELQEAVAWVTAQLDEARAAAHLWKRAAHDNRLRLKLCGMGWDGASELNKKLLAENANLVSRLLRDTAATDDPYHAFGQWAAANGYDLDTQDGRDKAIAAYGEVVE